MRIFITIFFLFRINIAVAQECPFGLEVPSEPELTCNKSTTVILFVNGLGELPTQPADVSFRLNKSLSPRQIAGKTPDGDRLFEVLWSYNYSNIVKYGNATGAAMDFLEAGAEYFQDTWGLPEDRAWQFTYAIFSSSVNGLKGIIAGLALPSSLNNLISAFVNQFNFDVLRAQENQDVSNIFKQVMGLLNNDEKLILLTHSQGGLISNLVWEKLEREYPEFERKKGFFSNFQIATPANLLRNPSSEYLTNVDDWITFIPGSLAPNIESFTNLYPAREEDGSSAFFHFMPYIYFNDDFPKYKQCILSGLVKMATILKSNCPEQCTEISTNNKFETQRHTNPDGSEGGLVSVEAFVAPTVTLDPEAVVCGRANVLDNVKIYDQARVEGSALITQNAVIADEAYVTGEVFITDDARVSGKSIIEDSSTIAGYSVITGDSFIVDDALVDESASVDSSLMNASATITDEAALSSKAFLGINGIVAERAQMSDQAFLHDTALLGGTAIVRGLVLIVNQAIVLGGNITSTATTEMFERLTITNNSVVLDSPTLLGTPNLATNTMVRGTASVLEKANVGYGSSVTGEAIVRGNVFITSTVVANRTQVSGSVVSYNSYVLDDARVRDSAWLNGAKISGFAQVSGGAFIVNGQVFENASISGSAQVYGIVHGSAQVGGTTIVNSDEVIN